MKLFIEMKKLKSTGFVPCFLGGGVGAGLLPILNTAFRTELFIYLPDPPLITLLNANSQMMIMFHLMLIICGSCIMYHTEYSEHALRKMLSLPLRPESLFLSKAGLLTLSFCFLLVLEYSALTFCAAHWFELTDGFWSLLIKSVLYTALLTLPSILSMLLIASACRNMWVSLGIGVICLSLSSSLTDGPFLLRLCPFIMPFQTFVQTEEDTITYLTASVTEILILGAAAVIFTRKRRYNI